MPEIVLDGRHVQASDGELVIEAAERAGVYIPRFCYHPRMAPVGMCRMCLVEISGPRGASLQPACFVSVAEGQEISTESPAARKAQEGVLEFLLVNHPLDCPVCDKGGECPLQDQSVSHGPGESRFDEEKRHWAKPIALGPLTLLDRERCIQCARCTRFAEEVAGEPLIDFYGRGDRIEVAVFPEHPFTSYFSGNTVQICPVGALTSVPYRFKSRPWDLEQVETTCTYCAVGCRVAAQSSAGSLVRYLGVDSEPVNQSWLCDRGRYGFEANSSPSRLTTPLVRRDGELVPVGWNEALRSVAERLSGVAGSTVGIIGGARLANEDAYAWSKLARSVIGTDHVDAQLGDGLPAELVAALPRATIAGTCAAKVVIVLAGDLREELPVLHLRLRSAAANDGLQIIECAPVPTALAEVAAVALRYRPGETVALARNLVSAGAGAGASGTGTAGGSGEAPGVGVESLGRAHGLLAAALESAADGSGIVVVLGRPSLAESALQVAEAAGVIAAAWPGVTFLPALRRSNVAGALDMGLAPGLLPGRVSLEDGRDWYESHWGSLPEFAGLDTAGMLEAAGNGEIGTLVLLGADPLSDFPDRRLATRALEQVPFIVAVDAIASPSTQLADVVLPAATSIERAGSTTNLEGRISRLAQKVVPPGQARPDWMIAVEIAELLGRDLGLESVDGIWEEIERLSPAHRGCTLTALLSHGATDGIVVPVRATTVAPRIVQRIDPMATPGITSVDEQGAPLYAGAVAAPDDPAATDDAGTAAGPADAQGSGTAGGSAEAHGSGAGIPLRPSLMKLAAVQFDAPPSPPPDGYAFRLVTRRSLYDHGTLVQAAPSLAPLVPSQAIRLRNKEIEQLGVHEGDDVRVRSLTGELVVPVVADDSLPAGVAVLAFAVVPVDQPSVADLLDSASIVSQVRVETLA
ncbi:MAG: NADH-quinone oxidoreductase subunit NuoG [Acidimicrobiales bacterium]